MSSDRVPNIILLQDYEDANTVVAGVLSLKGCRVHKSTNSESCLSIVSDLDEKADVVLIKKEIALSRDSMVLKSIKKINPGILVIVLANNGDDEVTLQEQKIDDYVQTPISAENLADKVLMLISKRELKRMKETQRRTDPMEQ
jgi:DNA-binding NtrC family response regulator